MQNSAYEWASSLAYSSFQPQSNSTVANSSGLQLTWSTSVKSTVNNLLVNCADLIASRERTSKVTLTTAGEQLFHLKPQSLNSTTGTEDTISDGSARNNEITCVASSLGSNDSPLSNCSSNSNSQLVNVSNNNDSDNDNRPNSASDQFDESWRINSIEQLTGDTFSDRKLSQVNRQSSSTNRVKSTDVTTTSLGVKRNGDNYISGFSDSGDNLNNNCSSVDADYNTQHLTMHPSNTLSTLSGLQQPSLLQLTANSIVQMSTGNVIGSSLNSTGTNGSSSGASSGGSNSHHRRTGNGRNKSSSSNSQQGKSFLCHVCHRTFTQKGNLKTHMMIHSGDKPYACNICGKSFTQKGNVDTHMKIHTGEKDYSCRSCGKGFTQRGNLKTHERSVHTKEKPYACTICGKAFSQKGNMVTHLRTHNKDDRFPCDLCGKTFSQKGNLKTHKLRHSGTLPARKYGQRRQNANRMARSGASHSGQHQQHNHHHQQGPSSQQQQLPLHLSASSLLGPVGTGQSNANSGPQFNMNHSQASGRGHLKSTDEESESSSVEHSMDGGLLHATVASHSNLMSPGRSVADTGIHVSTAVSAGLHHTLNDTNHVINRSSQPGAPLSAFGFANHRFYSPSTSTISAPQAHLAATAGLSWLTSVAASSATAKSRMTNHHHHHHHHHHPHDSFGLNAAAAYTAAGLTQHPNHNLARLTLLPTSASTHHTIDHHLTGGLGIDKQRSSGDHHTGQAQNDYHTSPQVSTASGQANPDFSQLLD